MCSGHRSKNRHEHFAAIAPALILAPLSTQGGRSPAIFGSEGHGKALPRPGGVMFRASDIHGAPAGPRGPALVAGKAAAVVPPPPWASGGKGWSKGGAAPDPGVGGCGGCPGKSASVSPPWATGSKGWSKGDMIPSPDVAPALPLNPVVPGGYGPAKAAQPQIPQPSVFAAPYGKGVAKTRPIVGKAFVPVPVSRQQVHREFRKGL
eukprot:s2902_g6.t1